MMTLQKVRLQAVYIPHFGEQRLRLSCVCVVLRETRVKTAWLTISLASLLINDRNEEDEDGEMGGRRGSPYVQQVLML